MLQELLNIAMMRKYIGTRTVCPVTNSEEKLNLILLRVAASIIIRLLLLILPSPEKVFTFFFN